MRRVLSLLVVALVVGQAGADSLKEGPPVKITGTLTVPAYQVVKLSCVPEPSGKGYCLWRISPSEGAERVKTEGSEMAFIAPPGRYDVEVVWVVFREDTPELRTGRATVVIAKPGEKVEGKAGPK